MTQTHKYGHCAIRLLDHWLNYKRSGSWWRRCRWWMGRRSVYGYRQTKADGLLVSGLHFRLGCTGLNSGRRRKHGQLSGTFSYRAPWPMCISNVTASRRRFGRWRANQSTQAEEAVIVFAKYTTLRQLVAALPVVEVDGVIVWAAPDESGWFVSKRPAPTGTYWAKFKTQEDAKSFLALLKSRLNYATLAAQDAGQGGLQ